MFSSYFLQTCLVLHIAALAVTAGTTVADYVAFNNFWKQFARDPQKGMIALTTMSGFPRLTGIGMGLLVLTGIGMMAIVHGVYGEQLWMRVKIAIVLLIILNNVLVGRKQTLRLKKMFATPLQQNALNLQDIKKRLSLFHLTQLFLFLVVFTLSVFKFN